MLLKITQKTYIFAIILTAFTSLAFAQDQITLIDFGESVNKTLNGPINWNNFTVQNVLDTSIDLKDINGITTDATLTLTDIFDRYQLNAKGTESASVLFGGFPLPAKASLDNFFGEGVEFTQPPYPPEPTGGFKFSGLKPGKYYSFTFYASRMIDYKKETLDIRETQYTITGNMGPQYAFLDASDNINNVAKIISVQPNSLGEITLDLRIGPNNTSPRKNYYIGAIEMTTSDTPSTTTWSGTTWDNVSGPNLATKAVINGTYNTATNGSFSAYDLTVNAGKNLTVDNNTFIEVEKNVVVNGELFVKSQGNFVQRDDAGTFVVNTGGKSQVTKVTATKAKWYYYTYWSSPVVGQTIGGVFADVEKNRRFQFNAANFIDQHTVGTTNGISDDVDDNGHDWLIAQGGTVMKGGIGYIAASIKQPDDSKGVFDFKGPFNTATVPVTIFHNSLNTRSWNLIGNPYPSAIDFDAFHEDNSQIIGGVVYLWSHRSPASVKGGNLVKTYNQDDYLMYTAVSGGVQAHEDDDIPDGNIGSGQSFFVIGLNGGVANFKNAMRMADETSNTKFFKTSSSKNNVVKNKLWINLTSDNGVFNQILTAYVDGATSGDDGLSYDAPRIIGKDYAAVLYTQIENSNKKFAIQGKAAKSLDANDMIKLGFASKIKVATLYKLSIAQIEGSFLKNNTIYLKDNLLNKVHNLSEGDYTFTSEVGEFNERFVVMFNNQTLGTDDVLADDTNALKIIDLENNSVKFITSNNFKIKSVAIFDLLGRQLYQFKGQNSEETYNLSNLKHAMYIAKVELSNGTIISKKAIKK